MAKKKIKLKKIKDIKSELKKKQLKRKKQLIKKLKRKSLLVKKYVWFLLPLALLLLQL